MGARSNAKMVYLRRTVDMAEHDALDRIRRAIRKTSRGLTILGPCIALLGAFMISLHAFELDSEAASMGTAAIGALYGFAILFIVVGLGMSYTGMFVIARRGKMLIGTLASDPARLKSATYQTIQHRNAPGELGKVHQLSFTIDGLSKVVTLQVTAKDVEPILVYVRRRAPHALAQ